MDETDHLYKGLKCLFSLSTVLFVNNLVQLNNGLLCTRIPYFQKPVFFFKLPATGLD